jgi:hypothetical protein
MAASFSRKDARPVIPADGADVSDFCLIKNPRGFLLFHYLFIKRREVRKEPQIERGIKRDLGPFY